MKPAVALVAVILLGFAGCGSDEPSAEEANATLCSELTQLASTVTQALAPGPDTTVEELKSVDDQVRSELDDVKSAAEDVKDVNMSELETAAQELEDALSSIPDSATLAEAADQVGTALTKFATAFRSTVTSIGCGTQSS